MNIEREIFVIFYFVIFLDFMYDIKCEIREEMFMNILYFVKGMGFVVRVVGV